MTKRELRKRIVLDDPGYAPGHEADFIDSIIAMRPPSLTNDEPMMVIARIHPDDRMPCQ
jgi:hypothetical protein